jgi:peptidoglycan/xylan/chitin deacetylase (PgdA/CDA1 family)
MSGVVPPIILMYHHIEPPPPTARIRGMYVTPAQFDRQIGWLLARGFTFTTFGGLTKNAETARRVIITLDDGYANNYHRAFPILRKHGIPAVVYPIISDLGRRGVVWPGATEQSPADMLTREQIVEMSRGGLEFGSHLLHHERLTGMTQARQQEELAGSRAELEALTGQEVLSIAYPYGDFDDAVVARTAASGYRYGVTTLPGVNDPDVDPLRLLRFTAKGCKLHHPLKFRRMIRGAETDIRQTWPA